MNKVTNKLVPDLRFSGFVNEGGWNKKQLCEILDYERPDNYIVTDTNYIKEGTPVLTANKSFVLGYTKEHFGIYNDLPAIIFDDFTVDCKFVDFPFKVKSSAIKILKPKGNDNLRFIFELMTQIRFDAIEHKRYYISVYQNLFVPLPDSKEQKKIASCLSSLDEVIAAHNQKLEALKIHKKGLMQNLFQQEGETVPKYRFPEFVNDGEWVEDVLINLAKNGFSNGVFNDPKKVGSGYRLINVINMYTESTIREDELSFLELSKTEFEKNKVNNGDIFFTRSSLVAEGIAKSNIYLGSSDDITYDGHLIRMRPEKEFIDPIFLHYILKSNTVRKQMIAKGKTATMTTIGQSDISTVGISYSRNPIEQQKIASCLSSLDDFITAQAKKIKYLKLHKKGLMQGLFPKITN